MKLSQRKEKVAFGLSIDESGVPCVLMGISSDAWEYMKDGKTHTFDLTKVGVKVRIMMFGCESHEAALDQMTKGFHAAGKPVLDERNRDFSIPEKGKL